MPSKKHSQDRVGGERKATHPNIARQLKKETVAFIWRTRTADIGDAGLDGRNSLGL
jgi:hypothetical protein